ncbi:TPA: restriction endonuclease subunit S [Vibrio vulnificus]|nr:restriction endonuclease subunit S [Vibrio vulnificus]HDY7643906.1 restriction endonuclease subunit S [Vibrio vulnificus]
MSKQNKKYMPKLRFPEFLANPGWEGLYGNQAFEQISDKDHNSDLPILAITQEYGAIPREMIDYNVSVSEKSVQSYKVVDVGDFVISLRSFQGGIEYSEYKGLCSPAYVILRSKKGVDKRFFKQYFKTQSFIRDLTKNLEGLRDGKIISYKKFSEVLLPKPSLEEQRKIADCLSSIDELIEAEGEKLDELKAHKKGLVQQLFPSNGKTVPQLRFPEFQNDKGWMREELFNILDKIIDYRGKAPPKAEIGVPLITAKNVRSGWLDMSCDEYIAADKYESWMSKGMPKAGDILFTTEAPLGHVAFFPSDGKFALGQRILTLRTKPEKCIPEFLFQSLLGPQMQNEINFNSTGSTAKGIKSSVFSRIGFCYPEIPEQRKIASFLSSIDKLILSEAKKVEKLKEYKKGLMQQLFPSIEGVDL